MYDPSSPSHLRAYALKAVSDAGARIGLLLPPDDADVLFVSSAILAHFADTVIGLGPRGGPLANAQSRR